MNYEVKDYQKGVIEYGIKNPYFINSMDVGLGKTLVSLEIAVRTKSKALIICPTYLMLKWESEIKKFFPDKIVSKLDHSDDFYKLWDTDFAIISYYHAPKADVLFEWADMVITDEAHYLKSMTTKRSEAIHKLVYENSIKRVTLLTGTPIQNRVYELYSLITLCQYNPLIEESAFLKKFPTYVDFANHFSYLKEFERNVGKKRIKIQQWEGVRNLPELKEWLKGIYIRLESDSVLNLPPYSEVEVPVSYEDNPELLEAFESFQGGGDKNSVVSTVKAEAALAKAPFTVDYVKDLLEKDLQVVIYSDHPSSAEFIAEKLGYTAITGATPMEYRQMMATRFQNGECKVLIATIGSFSTGIDLFSAQNMVFNDLNWVPGNIDQVKGRIRRLGQKKRCIFHYIIGSYQDTIILNRLEAKRETIRAVI
jgi:SWI/SNF-related matrix-associated actin-dependent regulator of chromatin subfamily A-like protein 1